MATVDIVELGEVDIVDNIVLSLLDCVENGRNLTNQSTPSIYMVPSELRDLSPSSFNPRVVSIGPLHREDNNVQAFEGRKAHFLHELLSHLDSPSKQTLTPCVQKVNDSIDQIRACYDGMETYTDIEFVKMMVMDACFILIFIYKFNENLYLSENLSFSENLSICRDLMLLENQIPFFVLEGIFECTILKSKPKASLITMLLPFIEFINPFVGDLSIEDFGASKTHDHILSLMHKIYEFAYPKTSMIFTVLTSSHSALELDRAGVNFKPNDDVNWNMTMKFESSWFANFCWPWSKPFLKMPILVLYQDISESVLRNLIAYEQSSPQVDYYVTSYAFALDMLVDTTEDVAKLVESKVLINKLGSNVDAVNMINNICKEAAITNFYYHNQWAQLDRYYNCYWPKKNESLRRTYFSGPWNFIALLAGIVLFTLTVVQTIFAIKTK